MTPSVLTCGDFGRSMAAELPGWRRVDLDDVEDRTTVQHRLGEIVSQSSVVAFATWRERRDISQMLDRQCHSAAVPWISIVAEHPWVRVGPGIVPRQTPCYECFSLRRLQHDRQPELSLALQNAYAQDLRQGVRGYLPHHLTIAAALRTWVHDKLQVQDEWRSPVAMYHTLLHEIVLDYVIGIHGCISCDFTSRIRTNDPIAACVEPEASRLERLMVLETEARLE